MPDKLTDFRPDPSNLNEGTERGNYALERSLRDYGFARPVVADKNGVILAGNHAFQKAGEIGMNKVRVIETSGDEVIVHKRVDLDANEARARMVALADNRTSEINLSFNEEGLKELLDQTDTVKNFFSDTELNNMFATLENTVTGQPIEYEPILNPTQGVGLGETDDSVARKYDQLRNQISGSSEQDLIDIQCPHCDEHFTVSRSQIE